jgi:hypothetical protein
MVRQRGSSRVAAEAGFVRPRLLLVPLILVAVVLLAAALARRGREGAAADSPVATLDAFYAAADASDGEKACAFLTVSGFRQIVRVRTRRACVATINGFAKGSFHNKRGEFVEVERVEDGARATPRVVAEIKGRAGGTFTFARRGGRLLVAGFKSEEG